jgi:DUF1016 N-terminal domain
MSDLVPGADSLDEVYAQIRQILAEARSRAWQAVNAAMVAAYWEVGRVIVEEEQQGKSRAEYGRHLLQELSRRLSAEFGKGFDRTNLQQMRNFYLAYPIRDALRHELAWTHYRLLLRVDGPEARSFYEAEAVNARWSTRELERQINSLLFERLALSKDKEGLMALAQGATRSTHRLTWSRTPMCWSLRACGRTRISARVTWRAR